MRGDKMFVINEDVVGKMCSGRDWLRNTSLN